MMPTLFSTLAPLRVLYRHHHPVSNHHIHHHIEYGGGEQISLNHSTRSLKRRPVVAAPPLSPLSAASNTSGEADKLGGPHHNLQDLKAPGPVQGIIRLV